MLAVSSAVTGQNWSLPTPERGANEAFLIPYPAEVVRKAGKVRFSTLDAELNSPVARECADRIMAELADVRKFWQMPEQAGKNVCRVKFEPLAGEKGKEGSYHLSVSAREFIIRADGYAGYFNALQTVRQLVRTEKSGGYLLPCIDIKDSPAFDVRGLMLDVGRNYMPMAFIKDVVRKLSYYKINVLHLHLTDDPGWRVEIKSHPELTDSTFFWKTRQPGKYYTQQEIKDLCAYCASLNIRVIPEVDMPGHSASFTKAVGADMQTERGMEVLKEALDEIIPLFEDEWFHIGSDEVHFKNKDFMPEMIRYIRSKGKEVMVWYPGYAPDTSAIRTCWGENEAGVRLDKSARNIDCNGFYLDWMDAQGGVLQTFFQQPCEEKEGSEKALGSIFCV